MIVGGLSSLAGCSAPRAIERLDGSGEPRSTTSPQTPKPGGTRSETVLRRVSITDVSATGIRFGVEQLEHLVTTEHSAEFRLWFANSQEHSVTFPLLNQTLFDDTEPFKVGLVPIGYLSPDRRKSEECWSHEMSGIPALGSGGGTTVIEPGEAVTITYELWDAEDSCLPPGRYTFSYHSLSRPEYPASPGEESFTLTMDIRRPKSPD